MYEKSKARSEKGNLNTPIIYSKIPLISSAIIYGAIFDVSDSIIFTAMFLNTLANKSAISAMKEPDRVISIFDGSS